WLILKHEYENFYLLNAQRWNSRIVLVGDHFKIYSMQPFIFTQDTRVIITDATGQPELYGKAFAYRKSIDKVRHILPREALLFDYELDPQAEIVQFTGTDNTRTTIRR